MALVSCPHCGHASRDAEFCDACNREIAASSVPILRAPAQIDLGDGQIVACPFLAEGWPDLDRTEPFEAAWLKPRRGRLHAISPMHWPQLRSLIEEREQIHTPGLPPVKVVPAEGGAIVVVEWWDQGTAPPSLPAFDSYWQQNDFLEAVLQRCRMYGQLMTDLHALGFVWLNFDPAAVEVHDGIARITNLDTVLFRIGKCPSRLRVSPLYSPPEVCRFQGERIGPASDVFHLAMFAYYALANLLPNGFAGRGLEAFGFKIPPLRTFQPALPVGIWPVISRGLSVDPAGRQATVNEFLADLERANSRSAQRQGRNADLSQACRKITRPRFHKVARPMRGIVTMRRTFPKHTHHLTNRPTEIGHLTIAGTAKTALGSENQDTVAVETILVANRPVQVMLVADGVSVCRIGRGELASQTATQTIVEMIRRQTDAVDSQPDWQTILEQACLEAGDQIVQAARLELDGQTTVADNEIMSTTVVIGVWDGSVLHLANAGDSRAYLIRQGVAEQLTVDGDMGTSQLAAGTPPEQVQELGVAAKSLRYCLGACTHDAGGQLVCNPERCRPACSRWTLSPGDTVILCSDGLVEEGVFLEPEDLAAIVTSSPELTAQQLVTRLVSEADRRQRPPSIREPAGFGDNIACVVLRIGRVDQSLRDWKFRVTE